MPAWAIGYLALLLVLTVLSVVADRRQGKHVAMILVDVLATLVVCAAFAAYFHSPLPAAIGKPAAVLFVAAFVCLSFGAHRDIQQLRMDPELSERQNLVAEHIGILLGVLVISPAIAFGALAVLRAW